MPSYRFVCERCGARFEERMSPVEHCQNRAECPRCRSDGFVHPDASAAETFAERHA